MPLYFEEIIKKYKSELFSPVNQWVDYEDENRRIICLSGRVVKNHAANLSPPVLNVVVDINKKYIVGHYLTFPIKHHRFLTINRYLELNLNKEESFFSNFYEKIYFLDSGKDVLIETYIHGENLFCSSISYLDEFNEQGVKAFENIKMSYCDLDEYLKAAGVNERKALKKISGFYN